MRSRVFSEGGGSERVLLLERLFVVAEKMRLMMVVDERDDRHSPLNAAREGTKETRDVSNTLPMLKPRHDYVSSRIDRAEAESLCCFAL